MPKHHFAPIVQPEVRREDEKNMLTRWQEPIFDRVAQSLPFIRSQPLSTFSLACILGDAMYIFNGKVGSLFNLGLGAIHPGFILTMGGIAALIGHIFLLASADKVDGTGQEHGWVTQVLGQCRRAARAVTLGWKPRQPFILGFGALALNGIALLLDAFWEMLFFGVNPAMVLQGVNGLVVTFGLGAAMLSRCMAEQAERDRLNVFAPKILAYGTFMTLLLGTLAVAPFLVLGGVLFVIGNCAQHYYALRLQKVERAEAKAAA